MENIKIYTPIKAIRKYCLECSAESVKEVRECHLNNCTLWPYRMGRRPKKIVDENEIEEGDE